MSLYEFKSSLINIKMVASAETKAKRIGDKNEFAKDIIYMENFLHKIQNYKASPKMTAEASNILNYLADRKEFWSQQKQNASKK